MSAGIAPPPVRVTGGRALPRPVGGPVAGGEPGGPQSRHASQSTPRRHAPPKAPRRGPRRATRGADERGAGTILIMICLMFLLVTALVALTGASWMRCAHDARNTADLAALAGAQAMADGADACAAARTTAAANGATLDTCRTEADDYRFLVRVGVRVRAMPALPGGPAQFTATATAGRT